MRVIFFVAQVYNLTYYINIYLHTLSFGKAYFNNRGGTY